MTDKLIRIKKWARDTLGFEVDSVYSGVSASYDKFGRLAHYADHLSAIRSILRKLNKSEDLINKHMLCREVMFAFGPISRILEHVFRRAYETIGLRVMHDYEMMMPEEALSSSFFHYSFDVSPTLYVSIFPKRLTELLYRNKFEKSDVIRYRLQSFRPRTSQKSTEE